MFQKNACTVPLDKAKVVREGTDVTIVGIQMTTVQALEAQKLEEDGISAEVIDIRSLVPLDKETILNSIKKTHRLMVVDEDYLSYGLTAEIAALAAEHGLYDLDAPVKRIAIPDVPIPYSRPLEQYVLPNAEKIYNAARELVNE